MADDENNQKSREEMELDEEGGTSTPPVPGTPPVNDAAHEKNLNNQNSILKKSVSSLPAAFGRSQSMGHSMRIKLAAEDQKEWFDDVIDEYYEDEFLAVRCAGKDDFWLCRVKADQKPGDRKIDIMWLEREPGSTLYTRGKSETIPVASVLTRVSLRKATSQSWKLPISQYKGIMKILLDDGDFEGDATDEKDESVSESYEEPEDEDEDEVEEMPKKRRGRPGKTPIKKKGVDDEEESNKKTPKKRAPRRKSVGKVDDEETEETPKKRGRKRKRADDDEAEDERPAKKQKKKRKNGPVHGEPNKQIALIETDPTFSHTGEEITKCCIQCSSREVIRAVLTKDTELLKKLIDDKENVWVLETQHAADIEENALTYAFKANNLEALKILLDEETVKKPRAPAPGYALQKEGTGRYSKYTFGHAVRSLTVGRGGKEGNNAFTADISGYEDQERRVISGNNIQYDNMVPLVMNSPLNKESLQMILDKFNQRHELSSLAENVYQAVQAGNREVAIFFVDMFNKRGGWGYNNLHYQALAFNGEEMEKFKPVSARKKTTGNMSLTPIHMACINPNPKYLKALLAASGLVNIEDGMQRSPLHYAAACTSSAPLDFLLAQGVDYFEGDLAGVTPLMIAAKYGRLACATSLSRGRLNQNVYKRVVNNVHLHEKLAEKINQAIKKLGDEGELSQAVIDKIVKDFVDNEAEALLNEQSDEGEDKAMAENNTNQPAATTAEGMEVDEERGEGEEEANEEVKIKEIKDVPYIDVPDMFGRTALHYAAEFGHVEVAKLLIRRGASLEVQDKVKMTPLAVAAQQGHLDCVKALVDGGANIEARDKVRRTPLIHAVKNGSVTVASYLVHMGADPNTSDSSINTAVHYAAAFGWKECLKYLISVGADANANNLWKTSPLAIAMMKGHLACADLLLDQKGVDVNVRNDNGDTLVIQVLRLSHPSILAQVRFLVQDKKADINLPDRSGQFPLIIAIRSRSQHRLEIVKILIENGAEVDLKDVDPVELAFSNSAFDVGQYLIERDAPVKNSKMLVRTIFTRVLQGVAGEDFTALLKLIASKCPDFRKVHSPHTGYLDMIKQFCAKYAQKNGHYNMQLINFDSFFAFMETYFQLVDIDPKEQVPFSPVPAPGVLTITQRNPDAGKTTLHFIACMKNDDYDNRLIELLSKAGPLPIDMLDEAGHTPLTRAIESDKRALITKLLELGAEINLHDEKRQFIPLHMVIARLPDMAQTFIAKGASVNAVQNTGNTPLHLAIGRNDLPLARLLVDRGADVTVKDASWNAPIHLAVQKRSIGLVQLLLEAKADINAPGRYSMTALHMAIEGSSAIIDSNFELEELLLKSGASVKALDVNKRTPLHYAFVKSGTTGMAATEAFDPIDIVATLCANKDCEVDALDAFSKSPLHYAAQHGATISSLYLLGRGAMLDRLDDAGNTPLAIALISGHPQYAISLIREKANVNGKAFIVNRFPLTATSGQMGQITSKSENSMFDIVVKNSWQGVAYLMLDGGCSYLVAMEASLKVQKYQLLLSLLSKTKDDKIVQQKSASGKTLLHFLAANKGAPINIAKLLIERGIAADEVDNSGSTALHYAAGINNYALCQLLVDEHKADVHRLNASQETPLLSYLNSAQYQGEDFSLGRYLVLKGADVNLCSRLGSKLRHLHIAVRNKNIPLISFCLDSGALIDIQDGQGSTVLMYAVAENLTEIVKLLLERSNKKSNLNVKDSNGKTAVHLVVSPVEYGSYENVEILELLAKHGADLNVKDSNGKTPMHYACLQDSGKMASALKRLGAAPLPLAPMREQSTIYGMVDTGVSPDMDAEELMKTMEKDTVEKVIPTPDSNYGNTQGHVVHSVNDSFYDILITKVDVQQGAYGQNMFYKMQVLHDQTKDMFVLWTRWGRVGDSGQHQKTPFPNAAESVAEFEKIFKSKTGNEWQERHNFEKKQGKYRLLDIDTTKSVTVHDILPKFNLADYSKQKSLLPTPWQTVLEQFANTSVYRAAMHSLGINTELMPLGRVTKDRLKHARKILIEIQQLLAKKQELSTGLLPDLEEVQTTLEKIVDLSNLFYETIPHANFRHESMHEISDEGTIKTKLEMLDSLIDYEAASKIILGSIKRSEEMHPLDYIYKAMNIVMEDVGLQSNEGKLLTTYIKNTGGSSIRQYSLHNIFRIQRRGEAERFQKWKDLDNHYLLWHGSSTANFMGILSQGLRIAPPEAPMSGYMFGKGLYFADMLEKSFGYCRGGSNGHVFLVLFEVALGNMNELYAASGNSDLPQGKNSTKGVGSVGPDWGKQIVLPNGVRIPLGPRTNTTFPPNTHSHLSYNEYIVYDTTQVRMRYLVHLGPKLLNDTTFNYL